MKSLKLSLFAVAGALLLSFSASAQQATPKKSIVKAETKEKNMTPSGITWTEDTHNFGDIEKGKPVSHEFTFKNTTKQTVLITNVKASCGCTATNYTKTPIKPGEMGSVTATYNAAHAGSFTKQVTVTTNDSDVNKVLHIKGKVIAPDTETPASNQ
ncbi:DUF1573 domain-containing protein [Flavobacterium sp. MK4S-17]|jgi:hypothetical protein|uniref:DUF1573 domain-containing protein n=1 Tax=Flavobacterium sp. MK4S-17 TaxID=2543737 RepID=UPI00135C15E6|nr:DUF1573 domain-containing protein [Flavobacterium sp. MK4S-17]